jgi:hypothetical protein
MSDENTIPITRPQTQHTVVPDVVKQVLEKEGKIPKTTTNPSAPDESYADVPQQFVEKIKYPTEVVDLPSRGWFYPNGHPLSSGKIEIKMMTAREEDILTSQNLIKKGIVLQRLLDSLIVDKRVKQDDILVCDMKWIFVAVRRLAYGDQYGPLKIKCPSCGEDHSLTIDLSKVEPKSFTFENYPKGINAFNFELPYAKKLISYKILTQKEDEMADAEIKNMSRVNKERSTEVTTRLKYVIQSLNGDDDKVAIRKFIETELVSKDTLELRKHIKANVPDLDMSFEFVCPACDFSGRQDIPMTIGFFLASILKIGLGYIKSALIWLSIQKQPFTIPQVYELPIYLRYFYLKCLQNARKEEKDRLEDRDRFDGKVVKKG